MTRSLILGFLCGAIATSLAFAPFTGAAVAICCGIAAVSASAGIVAVVALVRRERRIEAEYTVDTDGFV